MRKFMARNSKCRALKSVLIYLTIHNMLKLLFKDGVLIVLQQQLQFNDTPLLRW